MSGVLVMDGKRQSGCRFGGWTLIRIQVCELFLISTYPFKWKCGKKYEKSNSSTGVSYTAMCLELWRRLERREAVKSTIYHLKETHHTRNLKEAWNILVCCAIYDQ
jgi:hypothetical protein